MFNSFLCINPGIGEIIYGIVYHIPCGIQNGLIWKYFPYFDGNSSIGAACACPLFALSKSGKVCSRVRFTVLGIESLVGLGWTEWLCTPNGKSKSSANSPAIGRDATALRIPWWGNTPKQPQARSISSLPSLRNYAKAAVLQVIRLGRLPRGMGNDLGLPLSVCHPIQAFWNEGASIDVSICWQTSRRSLRRVRQSVACSRPSQVKFVLSGAQSRRAGGKGVCIFGLCTTPFLVFSCFLNQLPSRQDNPFGEIGVLHSGDEWT